MNFMKEAGIASGLIEAAQKQSGGKIMDRMLGGVAGRGMGDVHKFEGQMEQPTPITPETQQKAFGASTPEWAREKQAALNLLQQMDAVEGAYKPAELEKTAGLVSGLLGALGGYYAGGGSPLGALGAGLAGYKHGLPGAALGVGGSYLAGQALSPSVMKNLMSSDIGQKIAPYVTPKTIAGVGAGLAGYAGGELSHLLHVDND